MVFCLLTILGSWALTTTYQSRGALAQSQRAEHSERCLEFAEAAVRETLRYLRKNANVAKSPLFAFLREDSYPVSLTMPTADLPHTQEMLKQWDRYSLGDGVTVTVLRRAYATLEAEERVPHEAVGVVRIECRVTGPRDSKVSVKEEYGMRSLLVAPSRPYDRFTFFLADPEVLLTRGAFEGDANKTIANCLGRLKSRHDALTKLAKDLEGKSGAGDLQRIFAEGAGPRWPKPEWEATQPEESTHGTPFKLHYFAWPVTFYSLEDSVELEALNLPSAIGPLVQAGQAAQAQIDAEVARIQQLIKAKAGIGEAKQACQALVDAILAEADQMRRILQAYKDFQDLVVEVAGDLRTDLLRRTRNFSAREQQYRSDYRFEGAEASKYAEEFLARDPIPNGVVFVQNLQKPLKVKLADFQGRLMIVAEGDIEVEQATVDDPNRDVLTLLALGAMEIKGPTQACVVSWGGRFDTSGVTVQGSLILDALYPTSPIDAVMRGTIERQAAIQTGPPGFPDRPPPDPEAILVILSPMPAYRKVST